MGAMKHWTERNIADFVYRISADFVLQLEKKLDKEGLSHKEFADIAHVSQGRVSQLLNNPGNLTLTSTVQWTRALNMKVALVAYDDGDPGNQRGPVSPEIFQTCWQRAGSPRNFFALGQCMAGTIHQLNPLPDIAGNATTMQLLNDWPIAIAKTTCTEKIH
ncbi:MAG TPA: helix-turn-helix transcriptional regulator [Terracidiphilus sp.]|nr:helix-turn-helix transcriptional regulator [Terracidiphilus sp.]